MPHNIISSSISQYDLPSIGISCVKQGPANFSCNYFERCGPYRLKSQIFNSVVVASQSDITQQVWLCPHKTSFLRIGRFVCRMWLRGVKLIFTGGHSSLVVALKGPNVMLGLYKRNYPLTRGKELSAAAG